MCKGSIDSNVAIPAVAGETYSIGRSEYGFGVLHPHGVSVLDCVACVQEGTKLTLSNLPQEIQDTYHVDDIAVVTFLESEGDSHDYVEFEDNDHIAVFSDLACLDIIAYVGVLDVTSAIKAAGSVPKNNEFV